MDEAESTKHIDVDEGTYWGRVRKNLDMLDVRMAFVTPHQLQDALGVLEDRQNGEVVSDEDYAKAAKIKRGIIHPDTGEAVFAPLRASMIVPMNMLMDGAMLLARTSTQTVFAQWLNQTYNALHYYANRNATNHDSAQQRLVAYVGATASSVAASLGIRALAKRRQSPLLARFAPFAAVAAADLLNLSVMRQSEFMVGVNVYDENGDWIGKSKRAGALAVGSCIAGRIFAAAPILIGPPLIMQRLEKQPAFIKRPWLRVPTLLGLVGLTIQCSVPLTFGLFRQTAQVEAHHLEKEIAHATRKKDGNPVHLVTYNKGI